MFSAMNRPKFDFQNEGAYHHQIHHNELCKSLSLRIHKTNHNALTCGFLLRVSEPTEETGYWDDLSFGSFSIKTIQECHRMKICN